MKDEAKTYYVTTNYAQFHRLKGNRDVKRIQKNKLIKSISEIGFITNPIIVNENMEVIDGQGRLSALQELRLPVPYIIEPGIGEKECKHLNINQTNWKYVDYIQGYAETGDKNYVYLMVLMNKHRWISPPAIAAAAKGMTSDAVKSVKNGTYYLSEDEFTETETTLDFISDCEIALRQIEGDMTTKVLALNWVLKNTNADWERIKKVLTENSTVFRPVVRHRVSLFLEDLSKYYNKGLQANKKISFDGIYKIKAIQE